MMLKRTTIAKIAEESGLILKMVETTHGTFLTRKIAINNTFYNAEKKRLLFSKPLLDAFFQTKHIHHDKRRNVWRISEGNDTIEEALQHAEDNNRLFAAYLQMRQEQWDELTWERADEMFLKLARRGVPIVPYPIPLDATVEEWIEKKKEALKRLNKSQELMPVFCAYHEPDSFPALLKMEFKESKLVGLHYFNLNDLNPRANLNALYELTYRQTIGTEVPLVIGFCPRIAIAQEFANASSAYVLSIYGIDVVSYYVASPEQVAKIEENVPEEYPYYDSREGGYNKSATQIVWYGRELTRSQLKKISTDEGLEPYMAHRWANFMRESEDLDALNSSILAGTSKTIVSGKSRWHNATQTCLQRQI